MRTLRLTLAYDGTDYAGWQRQANAVAIQQVLEEAFAELTGGVVPTIAGAGRTDAGVHALAQVASVRVEFSHSCYGVKQAMNTRLPPSIRVIKVEDVTPGFHAQFDAAGKCYRYRIVTSAEQLPFAARYTWHVPWPIEVPAMQQAAMHFVGTHDFASLQASGTPITETVRTMHRVALIQHDDELWLEVEGDGFLRHMVRTMAGTLVEVGSRHRAPDSIPSILDARHRAAAGKTAPAKGLTLVSVKYGRTATNGLVF
jgi:tRNA pseudouridine38-40 synthase